MLAVSKLNNIEITVNPEMYDLEKHRMQLNIPKKIKKQKKIICRRCSGGQATQAGRRGRHRPGGGQAARPGGRATRPGGAGAGSAGRAGGRCGRAALEARPGGAAGRSGGAGGGGGRAAAPGRLGLWRFDDT